MYQVEFNCPNSWNHGWTDLSEICRRKTQRCGLVRGRLHRHWMGLRQLGRSKQRLSHQIWRTLMGHSSAITTAVAFENVRLNVGMLLTWLLTRTIVFPISSSTRNDAPMQRVINPDGIIPRGPTYVFFCITFSNPRSNDFLLSFSVIAYRNDVDESSLAFVLVNKWTSEIVLKNLNPRKRFHALTSVYHHTGKVSRGNRFVIGEIQFL